MAPPRGLETGARPGYPRIVTVTDALRTAVAWLCALAALPPVASASAQEEIVDLTHPFDESTVYWPTAEPFVLEVVSEGRTEAG